MFYKSCQHLPDLRLKTAFIESAIAGYFAYQFKLNQYSGEILMERWIKGSGHFFMLLPITIIYMTSNFIPRVLLKKNYITC